jgi:hypothetical protein
MQQEQQNKEADKGCDMALVSEILFVVLWHAW